MFQILKIKPNKNPNKNMKMLIRSSISESTFPNCYRNDATIDMHFSKKKTIDMHWSTKTIPPLMFKLCFSSSAVAMDRIIVLACFIWASYFPDSSLVT